MRLGVVAQPDNSRAAYLADTIQAALSDDATVVLDVGTARALDEQDAVADSFTDCDLVVSIGGDGTFLYAARQAGTVPVMGVNLGEVGFLNAVGPEEAVEAVRTEVERFEAEGAVQTRELPRLAASGTTGEDQPADWTFPPALNDVVVLGPGRGRGRGLAVEARVDGSLYAGGHADGVLVATPTGSTAYNLSEDGPLIRPDLDAMVVTGMAPDTPIPPLVVGIDSDVRIRVTDADHAVVTSDGTDERRVDLPHTVSITAAAEPARVAGPGVEFFRALSKLSWTGTH
ncbi:MAG: NAD(+)/NADH kinase [Halobacteriaceae archaeon]